MQTEFMQTVFFSLGFKYYFIFFCSKSASVLIIHSPNPICRSSNKANLQWSPFLEIKILQNEFLRNNLNNPWLVSHNRSKYYEAKLHHWNSETRQCHLQKNNQLQKKLFEASPETETTSSWVKSPCRFLKKQICRSWCRVDQVSMDLGVRKHVWNKSRKSEFIFVLKTCGECLWGR